MKETVVKIVCPKCESPSIYAVTSGVEMRTPQRQAFFNNKILKDIEGGSECITGGKTEYKCIRCGHIVGKTYKGFVSWLKKQKGS